MEEKIEIERRWLLLDETEYEQSFPDLYDLTQVYLINTAAVERIRQSIEVLTGNISYTHTIKKPNPKGGSIEQEESLTREAFEELIMRAKLNCQTIIKQRRVFQIGKHKLEIDQFHHPVSFKILEIELSSLDEAVSIPEELGRVIEITGEKSLSNYKIAAFPDMAKKRYKQLLKDKKDAAEN